MSSSSYIPEYSTISISETQKLASVKASGACWAIYTVLCSYSRSEGPNAFTAFPSWETINKVLGNVYSSKTICNALAFLEKHNIIQRKATKKRRSKTIHLITRKIQACLKPLIEKKPHGRKKLRSQNNRGYRSKHRKQPPEISKKFGSTVINYGQKKIREDNHSISMNRASETLPEECIRWYENAVAYILEPTIWPIPDKLKDKQLLNKLLKNKWFPPGSIPAIKKLAIGEKFIPV